MIDFFNSSIVKGVLAAIGVVVILGLFGWLKFRRDEKIVIEFLKESGVDTEAAARRTDDIASATRLSKARINRICRRSTRIRRHRKQKGYWILS